MHSIVDPMFAKDLEGKKGERPTDAEVLGWHMFEFSQNSFHDYGSPVAEKATRDMRARLALLRGLGLRYAISDSWLPGHCFRLENSFRYRHECLVPAESVRTRGPQTTMSRSRSPDGTADLCALVRTQALRHHSTGAEDNDSDQLEQRLPKIGRLPLHLQAPGPRLRLRPKMLTLLLSTSQASGQDEAATDPLRCLACLDSALGFASTWHVACRISLGPHMRYLW